MYTLVYLILELAPAFHTYAIATRGRPTLFTFGTCLAMSLFCRASLREGEVSTVVIGTVRYDGARGTKVPWVPHILVSAKIKAL